MRLLEYTPIGLTIIFLNGTASAQTAKVQKKCAVSYKDCVAKSMKDGWSQAQASNYCANQRPCVKQ